MPPRVSPQSQPRPIVGVRKNLFEKKLRFPVLLYLSGLAMIKKSYMVVENYKDAAAVYRRLWERGRMGPKGLVFVSAWFEENHERGYRLMKTHDRGLLDEWMANWNDLMTSRCLQ